MTQGGKIKHIVMLCSLDTKADESLYLQQCLEEQGAHTILIDIGYGRRPAVDADIRARHVAEAAGTDIETVRTLGDTEKASALVLKGAIVQVQQLFREGKCDGIVAFGGASNTTLATGIMKSLPIGVPKLMISSAAAIPAYSAMYFGSRDITIMHSVVDISGLNDLTRAFLRRGAGGIFGMVSCSDGQIDPSDNSKMIAITSFRFAETCCQHVIQMLELRGYTVIPFHAQGIGEDSMEDLIRQNLFCGVVDLVPAGLSEALMGGNRAARTDRLTAAGEVGIPQVIATSGFDMISCGPISRQDNADALWVEKKIAERQINIPDRFRVEARTTAAEVAEIAAAVAGKINLSSSPVCVAVANRGWSSLSVKGADLYNPEADAAFVPALKAALTREVTIKSIDQELNSEVFAEAVVDQLENMLNLTTIQDSKTDSRT